MGFMVSLKLINVGLLEEEGDGTEFYSLFLYPGIALQCREKESREKAVKVVFPLE